MAAAKQICAQCGGKMRYEVRQQDGKWLVWDTVVDDCAMKSVVGAVDGLRSIITSNNTRYMLNGGLLVPMPNSVTFETRPALLPRPKWPPIRSCLPKAHKLTHYRIARTG